MEKDLEQFVKPFKRHDKDNGSPEVQIATLTYEIQQLQEHVSDHGQDYDAKRGLLKKVARRRKFLKYLKRNDKEKYTFVREKLDLKA